MDNSDAKGSLIRRILIITFVLMFMFAAGWFLMYPSTGDPKNIEYVLWKAGLFRMNPDKAVETMVGDADRDKLVIGKTEAELRNRFGFLSVPVDASQYVRVCYQNSSWTGKRVLFIRSSAWMVVFDGDRASNLVLIKGC